MLLPAEMALTIRSEFPRIARELDSHEYGSYPDLAHALRRLGELNLFTLVSFAPRAVTLKISGWEAFEVSVGHAEHEDPVWSLGQCLTLLAERAKDTRLADTRLTVPL